MRDCLRVTSIVTIARTFSLVLFICCSVFPFIGSGQEYFQQEVNYEIHVSLDDERHQLHATETIEYVNNSTSTLTFIWFHIWPNAYKDGQTALSKQMRQDNDLTLFFSKPSDRGWIDSLDFQINGQKARMEIDHRNQDICRVFLNEPLAPGERITISTPFTVQIPKGIFSRLGHLGQAYQITQWYPKPAVFDKDGWHQMPYLGQGEFYSEFGTFDVHITLPQNYVVGATGDLVNGESELAWLDEKVKETEAIAEFDYRDMSFPASASSTKTLHYHQEKVHDFAWFADKRYHVLKGEVELPKTKRKVTTWAMFTNNEADLWKNSIEYLNDATYYYSLWVGEYPYNQVTAVDGVLSEGGGMEYPNVTIIGESGNAKNLEETIMHEVGHNWFYGMLGSNERDHPWMDEGLNSFIESRYMDKKYPNLKFRDVYGGRKLINFGMKWAGVYNLDQKHLNEHAYRLAARTNTDQAIDLPSEDYTSINYGTIVYAKTALVFNYLMKYLGQEKMDEIMLSYYQQWKYKHPQPEDLKKVMIDVVGDSLPWFLDDVIGSHRKLDYSIAQIKKEDGKLKIKVRNMGKIAGPFPISGITGKDTVITQWFEPVKKTGWVTLACKSCDRVVIDSEEVIPDINRKNNSMRVKGFLRKVEPIQPRFVGYYENPYRSQFALAPTLGWNTYDGLMLGFAVYNDMAPENKFSYMIMPMYAFDSKTITGSGRMSYTFHQEHRYPNVTIGLEGQRFNVGRISPFYNPTDAYSPQLPRNIMRQYLLFDFLPNKRRSNMNQSIRLRNTMFFTEQGKLIRNIPQITYHFKRAYAPHIAELTADLQWLNNEAKFGIEAIYRFKFKRGYGIRARMFFGKFINRSSTPAFNFRMASFREFQDYLYEGTFIGRKLDNGFLSQQLMEADGGFKSNFSIGSSNDWILALNLSSTLYRRIPIELFASVGTYARAKSVFPGSQQFLAEFGVSVIVVRDVLEVHFPFLYSRDVSDNVKLATNNYGQQIRFTFNLNELKPIQRLKSLLK
ncbi:MAG: M1 family metallopeptidase [Flavobacteriales bacterium]|nr:M1 family metallopeptidase [Flavobacteriales bacterium]